MRHPKSRYAVLAGVITFALGNAMPALSHDVRASGGDCRAAPERGGEERLFAEKLEHCNGVLEPPNVGDTELVMPAPDVGRTPIIRPDDLPKQRDSPNLPPEQPATPGNS